jgi:hypothetical protein
MNPTDVQTRVLLVFTHHICLGQENWPFHSLRNKNLEICNLSLLKILTSNSVSKALYLSTRTQHLTPKGQRVFLLKNASKQPLLKTSWIVQNWNQFWYFQPWDLVANFYVYMPTKSHTLIHYHLWDHNIQSWRNVFFGPCQRGTSVFWGPKILGFQANLEWASLDSCS